MLELSKYILAILLISAGVLHFIKPKFYLKIMPSYLPMPYFLVILSGIAEIICGILLLFPSTQNAAAYLTVALLTAVFPANIAMSSTYYFKKKKGFLLTLLRLPVQFLMIWWALQLVK